jgi:hypothetical protein
MWSLCSAEMAALLLVAAQPAQTTYCVLPLPPAPPQDAANALWALATLQIRPSNELLSFLLVRLQSHFPDVTPCEASTTLWALAQLQAMPPSSWLQELLLRQVGRQQWQHTQARHWVMCLTACAHLKQVGGKAG